MKKLVMVVTAAALVTATVQAGPLFNVNGASGQSLVSVNQGSGNYWAGDSNDFAQSGTIGNFLTGTGAFAGHALSPNIALNKLRAFQQGNGSAESNLRYAMSGANDFSFTFKIAVAGLSGSNQLWYRQGNVLTRIFAGGVGENQSTSVTITGEFELFIIRGLLGSTAVLADLLGANVEWARSGNGDSLSKTRKGGTLTEDQKFAIFRNEDQPGLLYAGVEDLWSPDTSDNDYNDLIIVMGLEEVPAPPALVLVALGIPALGLARRFTRKAPAAVVA